MDEPVRKFNVDGMLKNNLLEINNFNGSLNDSQNRKKDDLTNLYVTGEIDFENENKEQAQKTKDNLSKSNYNLIKSEEELKKLIHKIEEVGELAIDTETNSLNPHLAKLVGISISFNLLNNLYERLFSLEYLIKKLKSLFL